MKDKFKVESIRYDDLDSTEKTITSDNGCGKDLACYIRITIDGEKKFLFSDAMEPEDAVFFRDLSWIEQMLIKCYQTGLSHGEKLK